jgi:hypothetical protein
MSAPCPTPWKTAHRSERAAKREARSIVRRRGRRQGPQPYRCPCGAWHVAGAGVV